MLIKSIKEGEFMVIIDQKLCKGCGICVSLCPKQALALNEVNKSYYAHPDVCIHCGMCELWCPDYAIIVERESKE